MIEFALVFPVLCALLFGIIDGGRFVGARVQLAQAAAQSARAACLSSTTAQSDVNTALTGAAIGLPGASVDWGNTSCTGGCGVWPRSTNDVVFIQVQYSFQAVFYKALFQKNITQTSRMVCE